MFAALSILSLVVFTLIAWSVPAVRISKAAKRGAMSAVLKSGPLLVVFGITALVVTGNFLAYTYVSPYLEQIAGQSPAQVSMLLLVYGAAGVITNFAVGPFASRAPRTSLGLVTALLAASLSCMNAAAVSHAAIFAVLAAWGAAYGALPVLLQTLVFKEASRIPGGADAATSINVSVFNAAIGLGSLLGGLLINLAGPQPIAYLSACFAIAGLAVILVSRQSS